MLQVRMDPRVHVSESDLAKQLELALRMSANLTRGFDALEEARALRKKLEEAAGKAGTGEVAKSIAALEQRVRVLTEGSGPGLGREDNLARVGERLAGVYAVVESADAAPTSQALASARELEATLARLLAAWKEIQTSDLPGLNERLRRARLPAIELPASGEEVRK
jgi:hypothetical protein